VYYKLRVLDVCGLATGHHHVCGLATGHHHIGCGKIQRMARQPARQPAGGRCSRPETPQLGISIIYNIVVIIYIQSYIHTCTYMDDESVTSNFCE
jgi:hypothetical protein